MSKDYAELALPLVSCTTQESELHPSPGQQSKAGPHGMSADEPALPEGVSMGETGTTPHCLW